MLDREQSARVTALIALVLAMLVAGAAPASSVNVATQAGDGLVVGSQHDTQSEFANAQTLDNLTATSAGDGAVELVNSTTIEDYEDDDFSEYQGDTGILSSNASVAAHGSQSLQASGNGNFNSFWATESSGLSRNVSQGDDFSFNYRAAADNSTFYPTFATQGVDQAWYRIEIKDDSNTIKFQVDTRASGGSISDLDSISADIDPDTWYRFDVSWSESGDFVIDIVDTSTGTTIGTLSATDTTYTEGGIGGATDNTEETWFLDYYRTGSGETDSAQYISAIHNVSNAEEAAINITQLSNTTATLYATKPDGDGGWTNVKIEEGNGFHIDVTSPANHTLTFNESLADVDKLRVQADINVTDDNPEFRLSDESILFTNHAPQADNLSPPNGSELTSSNPTFSVDVSDQEFPTAQSDEVTAELFVDGNSVGSKTVTSNTTVSISTKLTQGGDHTYHWELTDSYGATTTTATNTVTVPSRLYLYNETANSSGGHDLLDGTNTSVEVTITGSEGSVKAVTVSDGTVDMSGLPSDESYVFTIDPDGYYAREIYIESIYDQAAVFLLNNSLPSVENSLTVTDRTGQYEQPIITVERVINTSRVGQMPNNGDQWVTIGGDRLGASGFYIVNLQADSRYRFVVINQDGNTRVLGEYTAKADGEVPLEIGSIEYDLGPQDNAFQWTTVASNDTGGPAVTFAYDDGANLTSWINATIRYRNNSQVVAQKNFTAGPYGEVVFTQPVNASQYNNREFVVDWTASRNGSLVDGKRIVGGKRTVRPPLADVWMEISYGGGVLVLAFVAGAGAGAAAAAVTVSIFAGLSVFIGLAPPALGFGATILALFLSVAMLVYGSRV